MGVCISLLLQQVMEISSEAREELEFIKFFLSVVSGSLHKLRLEKFSRWKDIPFPVAVRMDQVQFVTDKVLRSDLFDGLVFDERNLEELAAFVMQLQDEIKGDSELLGKLAEDYTKLQREQVIFSKRIEDLKKDCQDLMVKKFGGIIDLDQADNVRCDPQLQELRVSTNGRIRLRFTVCLRTRVNRSLKSHWPLGLV